MGTPHLRAVPSETPNTLREQIRQLLLSVENPDRTMNINEITEKLSLPRHKVAATIYNLNTTGRVVSSGTFKDKRYRWVGGEEQMKTRAQKSGVERMQPVLKHLTQIAADLQDMVAEVNQQIKRVEASRAAELEEVTRVREENKVLRAAAKEWAGKL